MIISIFNHKNRSGKSSSCINLAKALCDSGQKVLVIDTDGKATLSRAILGSCDIMSLSQLLRSGEDVDQQILPLGDLDLLPNSPHLDSFRLMNSPYLMHFAMKYTFESYDFVLIDTPSILSNLSLNGLLASDFVLIPFVPGVNTLREIKACENTIDDLNATYKKKIQIMGLLPGQVDHAEFLDSPFYQNLDSSTPNYIFKNFIQSESDPNWSELLLPDGAGIQKTSHSMKKRYVMLAHEVSRQIFIKA